MNETEEGCGLLAEVRERLGVWGLVQREAGGVGPCAERLELNAHCMVPFVTVDVAGSSVHV